MDSQLQHEPHFTAVKVEETSALVAHDLAYAPARQAQQLYDALLPLIGAENVELVYMPEARHADAIFPSSSNMPRVVQFFERHLR